MADQPTQIVELGFTLHLQTDYIRCAEGMFVEDEKDRQFWRRMACRSLFGWLESVISVSRSHFVLDLFRVRHEELLKDDESKTYFMGIHLATDPYEWSLEDNGTGKKRKRKLRFIPTLKAVVRMLLFLSRVPKAEVEKQFGTDDWQRIKQAVGVRDRITHPHKHEDAFVSDDESRCLMNVAIWFLSFIKSLDFSGTSENYSNEAD